MRNWSLENIVFSLGDAVLKTSFIKELKKWRKISLHSAEEIKGLQKENLRQLLLYCAEQNPYYKKLLPPANAIQSSDPELLLRAMPLLTKEVIRNNKNDLISLPYSAKKEQLIEEKSSGSSGVQGSVLMTKKEVFSAIAAQTHLWEWAGYRLGKPLLQLGITPERGMIKNIKDRLLQTTYKPAFSIDFDDVIETLKKFKGNTEAHFGGYASGLYSYAQMAEKAGLEIQFQSIISWGDKLFPHYRKKIESVFQTQVYDTYGCTEGFIIAGQCAFGSYHILTPNVYLELLDSTGNEVAPGQIGYVVATRLDNRSFPLIRYQLGDLAVKEKESKTCDCGRPYPLLSMIIGRDTDIVYTPLGKPLIVHFFTGIFEHEQDIKQYRIIQTENKNIIVEYITDLADDAHLLQRIKERINERSGELLPVSFNRVTTIAATKSGKPQIIKSMMKQAL